MEFWIWRLYLVVLLLTFCCLAFCILSAASVVGTSAVSLGWRWWYPVPLLATLAPAALLLANTLWVRQQAIQHPRTPGLARRLWLPLLGVLTFLFWGVGALPIAPPQVRAMIWVLEGPQGSRVLLNGREVGTLPLTLDADRFRGHLLPEPAASGRPPLCVSAGGVMSSGGYLLDWCLESTPEGVDRLHLKEKGVPDSLSGYCDVLVRLPDGRAAANQGSSTRAVGTLFLQFNETRLKFGAP